MTQEALRVRVEATAKALRILGGSVEINHSLPYVAVACPDGAEYFFQEHEASALLDEVPDYVAEEDYILWVSQGW